MSINPEKINIAVVGLGYVGLPLAVEFSRYFNSIGYDLDPQRIDDLKKGYDKTNEVSSSKLLNLDRLHFAQSADEIKDSNVYIVTVPTPVDKNNKPLLNPLLNASRMIGKMINPGDTIIYESTVFPGATEDICVPVLEAESGLKYNEGFHCGYSPERINPGDKKYTLTNIIKITSGSNPETAEFVDFLYKKIITVGTFKASSIAVAEAAKVIENTQRDVNIALVNELALIFHKLGLDTGEVLEAAGTKWNFLKFYPGLVGGHCIGVDPYYLTHKAVEVGYHPEMILAGRRINDNMGQYIAEKTIAELVKQGVKPTNAKIAVFGLTFKEDCPDLRNTKVINIIESLKSYGGNVAVVDKWADSAEAKKNYDLELIDMRSIINFNVVILAVKHDYFRNISEKKWQVILKANGILIDVKSVFPKSTFENSRILHWRL